MTTEEKAKAYDEALERAKANYELNKTMGFLNTSDIIANIFPQLRESEDERVRKIITDSVFYQYGAGDEYKDVLDYLDKLEQQEKKEVKFVFPKFLYARTTNNKTIDVSYAPQSLDAVEYIRSDSLQQEWSEEDEKMLARIIERGQSQIPMFQMGLLPSQIAWLKSLPERFNPQPKAEWSEEDESMRWNVISIVGESKSVQAEEMMDWLKSLPERFNLPSKQEWSEEDSIAIKVIQMALAQYCTSENQRRDLCRWLDLHCNAYPLPEKLYPHWKPSEEQMDSLRDTIIHTKGYSYSMYLPEIYEQLKKL